jgi:2-hydroxychromene-2-carboxylate isomerase
MTQSIDLFWSFRSPYSYLATARLCDLADEHDVDISVRPVLPIAVRTPEFFESVNPLWPPYLVKDVHRLGDFLGIPFRWPRPDPVVQDYANRTIPKQQPYIHRLTRLGVAAAEQGQGLAYLRHASHLIWSGEVDGWDEGEHLEQAAAKAGLDGAQLEETARNEADRLDAIVEDNQQALDAAGHWGVPTMVFEGEPFFGQDRVELLIWRLKENGMTRRG